ncbi:unnamed protein product [Protopolystoma xenopodis]|uniref:Uncharacterized protein n=1 Tax=Protopolystoma xenopodis TaxID=117903 RepID=A0A3S5BLI7_9PLAT|nr:unnamed protein product [Protopolystoma xenopodis]
MVLTRQRVEFTKTRKYLKDCWKAEVKRMIDAENSLMKIKSAYIQRCQTGIKLREELALAQSLLNETLATAAAACQAGFGPGGITASGVMISPVGPSAFGGSMTAAQPGSPAGPASFSSGSASGVSGQFQVNPGMSPASSGSSGYASVGATGSGVAVTGVNAATTSSGTGISSSSSGSVLITSSSGYPYLTGSGPLLVCSGSGTGAQSSYSVTQAPNSAIGGTMYNMGGAVSTNLQASVAPIIGGSLGDETSSSVTTLGGSFGSVATAPIDPASSGHALKQRVKEIELMYGYREAVEIANHRLVELEKRKVSSVESSLKFI